MSVPRQSGKSLIVAPLALESVLLAVIPLAVAIVVLVEVGG